MTTLSIRGVPVDVTAFTLGIHEEIQATEKLIGDVFEGCEYQDIFAFIDSHTDRSPENKAKLFRDNAFDIDESRCVFVQGFEPYSGRLLHYLTSTSKYFNALQSDGSTSPNRSKTSMFRHALWSLI